MLDCRLNIENECGNWMWQLTIKPQIFNFDVKSNWGGPVQYRQYLEIEIKRKEKRITSTEKTIAKTVGRGIPLMASSSTLSEKISVLQKPENKFKVSQHSASVKLKLQPSDLLKLEQVGQFNQHVFGKVGLFK